MKMPTEVTHPVVFLSSLSPAASTLPPEQLAKAWSLIAIIGLTGVILVLMLVGLIVLRRVRGRATHAAEPRKQREPLPDAWQESARRMKVEPEPEEED